MNNNYEHYNMTPSTVRQIFLDTETTGMNKLGVHYEGHRIIEIGAVEAINRRITGRHYHAYVKPNRLVDLEAYNIHGISDEFLADKPTFNQIVDDFLNFIRGSELIIHNAMFDLGFLDYEFRLLEKVIPKIEDVCNIVDSLVIARRLFPGKRNNLDALCSRYNIDNRNRTLHGALLDADLLAKVYLAMTGGQISIIFQMEGDIHYNIDAAQDIQRIIRPEMDIKVIYASDKELASHERYLNLIMEKSGSCLWQKILLE
ncbi:DNA polymerase III, e subunit [Serratia symbiotica str. 'Cinara cedri']|nr:DNA polymerase III, e subunit [Serratia symbiotica str. 'Cinara cedri']